MSMDNPEADGLLAIDPEEEEAAAAQDGGEEGGEAEGEGDEGKDGEAEGDEGGSKVASKVPAAAKKLPVGLEPFPLKRKVSISLGALPAEAHSLVVSMANFGGSGFKRVRSLQLRLLRCAAGGKGGAGAAAPVGR